MVPASFGLSGGSTDVADTDAGGMPAVVEVVAEDMPPAANCKPWLEVDALRPAAVSLACAANGADCSAAAAAAAVVVAAAVAG